MEALQEPYRELLKNDDYSAAVERVLQSDSMAREVEELGSVLAVHAEAAEPLFSILQERKTLTADTLQTEMLVWLARGDETPRWKRKNRDFEPVVMSTGDVGKHAVKFLSHSDPFVRGLADFAIAIRVGVENIGRTSVWPTENPPSWYTTWEQFVKTSDLVELDYARQGAMLGLHHSAESLLASAEEIVKRVEALAHSSFAKNAAIQGDLSTVHKQCNKMRKISQRGQARLSELRKEWIGLRKAARKIVMADPAFDFSRILMATRHGYHDGPNITAGAKPYIVKPGGDIYIKNGFSPDDPVKPLLDGQLQPGHMRGMELWWDADRLVFAYAEQPNYFDELIYESDQGFSDKEHGLSQPAHLYEIHTDGTGLRQITSHEYNSDVEPTYLPNGDIIFCSDRSNFGSQCSGHFFQNKKIVNMYRIDPDGSDVRAVSNNKDFDRYSHILNDGRIIFTRWEYQERHLYQTHNLWTSHPDGRMSDAIYKQHIDSGPMALRDARPIPDSHKMLAIACGHHEFAQGAVTLIDHHQGVNNHEGMQLVTPHISPREGGLGRGKPVASGGIQDKGGLYQQPYPMSEHGFLVSYSYHLPQTSMNATNFGLYYIDVFGNKELIHREPVLSVVYPIPLKKRPVPPMIPDHIQQEKPSANVYAIDVHSGVPAVQQGEIKYLRIAHRTEWPTKQTGDRVVDYNHLHYTPSGSWSRTLGLWTWTPARVIGTVPVAEDGSVYFKAPSNIPLYFQALDENYMEIRRMRSFVIFQPGEMRGCTGCHETRDETPLSNYRMPKAVAQEPAMPKPPSWGNRALPDYEKHIEPIITKYCADCHRAEHPAAGLEFTSRKIHGYSQAYRTMFGLSPDADTPVWEPWAFKLFHPEMQDVAQDKDSLRKMEKNQYPGQLISISNRFGDARITEPYAFGSTQSKFITTLLKENHQRRVKMEEQEWIDLVTWVDLNAPYWGSFVDKEPVRDDQPPKRIEVLFPEPFLTHYPAELEFSAPLTQVQEKTN